ncbi:MULTISPECIES: VOC family protein [unclassified Variovorax]|uniref:VOC family protein n=1 Tax=unclassified Variovorax TaxID=663243 RepID=UPI003F45CBA1
MQKIVPCLWFDGNGEEAVKFYSAIFPDARVTDTLLWGHANPAKAARAMQAMMKMVKLDIAEVQKAFDGA